jgi:hypothetical protein
MCVYVWGILISWWGKTQPYFNRLLPMLQTTHSKWKCVMNMSAAYNENTGTVCPLSSKAQYHHKRDTITINLQIRTYRYMLHIILVNAGLEHTQRWFLRMLGATTRENLWGKDVCSPNLESQPTAQYIQGNNMETKHQLIHIYTCIHKNYSSLVMRINEPSPGRIIRT